MSLTIFGIELPSPTWEDTEAISGRMLLRRTLSNKPRTIVFRSAKRNFEWTIPNIMLTSKELLEAALLTYAGTSIVVTDHHGDTITGMITNYPFEIVESSDELFSATINFKGVVS